MPTHALTPDAIMQLGFAFWASKTLLSAVRFGLFTELAAGSLATEALIQRLGLHPRGARDFLDALVALNMLERIGDHYANTPATNLYLDRNKPTYMGGILEMADTRLYGFWGGLSEALRTGEPQNEAKLGRDLFDELYADPQRLAGFLRAMTGLSLGPAAAIASKFSWDAYRKFADLGTAEGVLAVELVRVHKHLTGIGFDLPIVRPHFDAFVEAQGFADRLTFQGGNFFSDPLPAADVLIMGHILHDWGLDRKRQLIAKAYDVLPPGGALIVVESIIDDDRRHNAFGLLMSLNMLIETREGFDFTAADCQGWMREAGFTRTWVEPLSGPDSMVVAIR